ncbi:MAG: OmpP1/FadL family transporter [Polyangiales bacterium]
MVSARKARAALLGGVLAAVLAAAPTAHANPLDAYGFGSRSSSLGGAVVADVEDFSANYFNPAGLVRGDEIRIAGGYFAVGHYMQVNGNDSPVDNVSGSVIGLVLPGDIEGFRFAVGLGLHLNDRRLSRTLSLPREQPRWILYDNRPHRIFLGTHLAIRPVDWLLLGGGLAFQSRSASDLEIRGDIDIIQPDRKTKLEHNIRSDLNSIRYPQVGVQIVPADDWSLGAAYRGEFVLRSRLEGDIAADLTGLGDPIPGRLTVVSDAVNAVLPQQVSFGGAWHVTEALRLSAEITWLDWSAFISPTGKVDVGLDIDVPPGAEGLIDVPDDVSGTEPLPARFDDTFVPRDGAEWRPVSEPNIDWDLRGGYFFEKSPAPEQTGQTNFVDADRHVVSFGTGVRFKELEPLVDGCLSLDFHVRYSRLPERGNVKDSLVNPTGDFVGSGHILSGGLDAELAFE